MTNFSTLWNKTDNQLTTTSWDRSWRCEEFTEYGSDFTIKIHMETIITDENKNVVSRIAQAPITRALSQVQDDPDVQAYLVLKQKLVAKWLGEDRATPVALSPETQTTTPPTPDATPAPTDTTPTN